MPDNARKGRFYRNFITMSCSKKNLNRGSFRKKVEKPKNQIAKVVPKKNTKT